MTQYCIVITVGWLGIALQWLWDNSVSYCNNYGMIQYRIVITVEWLNIVLQYLWNDLVSYCNNCGMTQYRIVITLLQYDTESFHSYYNTILSHSSYYNTILSHPTVITIRYWVIPQLLQCDTYCNNWNDSVSYCNNCEMTQYRIVITVEWLSIVL
jgi:hypothetical protein